MTVIAVIEKCPVLVYYVMSYTVFRTTVHIDRDVPSAQAPQVRSITCVRTERKNKITYAMS